MILQTDRLILRKMTREDFPALCRTLQDEKAMYAYAHAFSYEEVQQWLDHQLDRYQKYGFGLWAVTLRDNDEMIGQCGLTIQNYAGKEVLEIGYLFQRDYWHHGYAIEAARACRQYAFEILNVPEVYSIIRDNNFPSQRVAERNGMRVRGLIVKFYHGIYMPHLVYSVRQEEL